MPNCSIVGCRSRTHLSTNPTKVSMHRLPTNTKARKKWLDVIGIENINILSKIPWVCSLHFEESCFNRTLNVTTLRENALPSKFLGNSPQQTKPSATGEHNKKNNIKSTLFTVDIEPSIPEYSQSDEEEQSDLQEGYYCNGCCEIINGYRYVCMECDDFDLCAGCERKGDHSDHCMLRVPKSRSDDEITLVLETIRKALLDYKSKINDSIKDEAEEKEAEDALGDASNDFQSSEDPITQLLCTETSPFEDNESMSSHQSNFVIHQKRKGVETDQFVPLKKQTIEVGSVPYSLNISNTVDKTCEDALKAFLYKDNTVLPHALDTNGRKLLTVTSPFITKINNGNPEKETDVVQRTPQLTSEANLITTDVSRFPSQSTVNNVQKHNTRPIIIKPYSNNPALKQRTGFLKSETRNVAKPTLSQQIIDYQTKLIKESIAITQNNNAATELHKRTPVTGLQQNVTPQYTTINSVLPQSKNLVTNSMKNVQSNIVTTNNIQMPGNIQSVIPTAGLTYAPGFNVPRVPNLIPAPAPDLILELSQNYLENGININVKRMTSEEKALLSKP